MLLRSADKHCSCSGSMLSWLANLLAHRSFAALHLLLLRLVDQPTCLFSNQAESARTSQHRMAAGALQGAKERRPKGTDGGAGDAFFFRGWMLIRSNMWAFTPQGSLVTGALSILGCDQGRTPDHAAVVSPAWGWREACPP